MSGSVTALPLRENMHWVHLLGKYQNPRTNLSIVDGENALGIFPILQLRDGT